MRTVTQAEMAVEHNVSTGWVSSRLRSMSIEPIPGTWPYRYPEHVSTALSPAYLTHIMLRRIESRLIKLAAEQEILSSKVDYLEREWSGAGGGSNDDPADESPEPISVTPG